MFQIVSLSQRLAHKSQLQGSRLYRDFTVFDSEVIGEVICSGEKIEVEEATEA